jgi:hypothetical protein
VKTWTVDALPAERTKGVHRRAGGRVSNQPGHPGKGIKVGAN